jgi:hypothetical protein
MCTRRYRIIVSGRLGMAGREAFRDLHIEPRGTDTALTGDLNRSGLHDVLTRIRDLALDLVGLACLAPGPGTRHQTDAEIGGGARRSQAGERPASPAAGDVSSPLTVDRLPASGP